MRRLSPVMLFALGVPVVAAAIRPDFAPGVGAQLDVAAVLTDEAGKRAPLAAFTGGRPSLFLFGYHRCPNLCGVAQLELLRALDQTGLSPDRYSVIFASIDPSETTADANAARTKLADADPEADLASWHFMTASASAVTSLEQSIGLTVERREGSDLYTHPVAVEVFTPEGRLSRVFPGIDYSPGDLRLALVEASEGKFGTLGEHILLLCSSFDPSTGRYTSTVMLGLRSASAAALLILAAALFRSQRARKA
jgi:protein SCO1/2